MPGLLYAAVMMAFVGFAEELIFRGFLFKAILKDGNVRTAIIISSVTFGLGHILNLLIGQDLIETLVQIVFAVAVGFVFTMTFYKGGSLWPCILAHSVIDVTSVFFSGSSVVLSWIIHIIVFALSIIYCIYLAKRVETPVINRVDMQQKEVFDPQ
jgi:membrane protease YdiL (CAAX protease family)